MVRIPTLWSEFTLWQVNFIEGKNWLKVSRLTAKTLDVKCVIILSGKYLRNGNRKFKCITVGSGAAYTGNTIQVNVYYVKV